MGTRTQLNMLFFTACVFLTSVLDFSTGEKWFFFDEVLPSTGECPEGKRLTASDCEHQSSIGACGVFNKHHATLPECWGGYLDSTTHGCGCIVNEDGFRYYNEPSGKSCTAGEEAKMVCMKEVQWHHDFCDEVDGWTVKRNQECMAFPLHEDLAAQNTAWFEKTHGSIDTTDYTIAECAALCTGDCVGFQVEGGLQGDWHEEHGWHYWEGCDSSHFYTTAIFSHSESDTCCYQKKPVLEEACGDYDAGEGWIVDCESLCKGDNHAAVPLTARDVEFPWITGVSISHCGELCKEGDCNYFNFSPQNGGSCQLFNGTLQRITSTGEDGYWEEFRDMACVHQGIPTPKCTDMQVVLDLSGCTDYENCKEGADGTWHCDLYEKSDGMEDCEWIDQMFSEGGCCEHCAECTREKIEKEYGVDSECEPGNIFSKIFNGKFSSLTTLEIAGLAAFCLILICLIVGLCCCCCRCSQTNGHTKRGINMC